MAKVALLIGVSDYEAGLTPLPAALNDIAAVQRVLHHPEMGGFDQVKTLDNPEPQAMQLAIEILFADRARDDLVVLFFSGHGIKDDAGRLYFASRITRKSDRGELIRATAVPTSFVREIMNNSRAKRQAVILDCCFSGAFDPTLLARNDDTLDLQTQLGAEGRVVLASSSSVEYSFEQKGAELSIYTRYLVEGIETGAGDSNSDGLISVLELHEYVASKVKEAAPAMTPKIIVMKDKGFEIVLAKARVTDPRLKYRKTAAQYTQAGQIRPTGRAILATLRSQLGLTQAEAEAIEADVLRPYQERLANLQRYQAAWEGEADHEYPLGTGAQEALQTLQQMLGLRDEDVGPIQKAGTAQRDQALAAYRQKLEQYEQAVREALHQEYPFSPATSQGLGRLGQSLGLKEEDRAQVEQPLLQPAELRHRENLRLAAERQRQERERAASEALNREAERQRQAQAQADYNRNLRQYEQEFASAVQAAYPLSQQAADRLQGLRQQLGLKEEDIVRIEQPLRAPQEAEYQRRRREAEAAKPGPTSSTKLRRCEFDVITVDKNGEENRRTKKAAEFWPEDLGSGGLLGILKGHGVLLEMVKIPGGTFQMGSPEGQGDKDEEPQHPVKIPPFLMGKYPVTQAQWRTVAALPQEKIALKANPSSFKGDNRPVETVSWEEAEEFCQRLARRTGHPYRLPSEAEWEYACRAGTTTPFYFGETITTELANYRGVDLEYKGTTYPGHYGNGPKGIFREQTTPVGEFLPNAFGLYDMHGNVWEWCADRWHDNYTGAPSDGTAWVTGESNKRPARGGSWAYSPVHCRSAYRNAIPLGDRYSHVGFRVVCAGSPGFF